MTAPRLYPAAKRAFDLAAASAGLLVRHVQKLDPRAMLGNGDLKPVLRRLAGGTLPRSVIHRTDKMGFTTPIGTFVNHSAGFIREQISNSRFRDLYDLKSMSFHAETKFSREVFGLLMLDLWLNEYAVTPPRAAAGHAAGSRAEVALAAE